MTYCMCVCAQYVHDVLHIMWLSNLVEFSHSICRNKYPKVSKWQFFVKENSFRKKAHMNIRRPGSNAKRGGNNVDNRTIVLIYIFKYHDIYIYVRNSYDIAKVPAHRSALFSSNSTWLHLLDRCRNIKHRMTYLYSVQCTAFFVLLLCVWLSLNRIQCNQYINFIYIIKSTVRTRF